VLSTRTGRKGYLGSMKGLKLIPELKLSMLFLPLLLDVAKVNFTRRGGVNPLILRREPIVKTIYKCNLTLSYESMGNQSDLEPE